MLSLRTLVLGVAATAALAGSASSQAAMIDDFSHGTFGLLLTPFSDSKTVSQTISSVAGGTRFVGIAFTPGGRFGAILAGQLPINDGQLYFQNILHTGGTLSLRYGDAATLNLDEGGDDALSSLHVVVDALSRRGSALLTATIKDTDGHTASSLKTITAKGDYDFPFAAFAGVNLGSVDTLEVDVRALTVSADVTLGDIHTNIVREPSISVPEPISLALLAIGGVGIAARRRRA